MRYHRLTQPVTSAPSLVGPLPETADPSADNGNRASIFRRVRRRHPRRLGVGIVPKLADLFRARYRADGVDFDSIRVHHRAAAPTPTWRAGRWARGRSRWGRTSTSRPGNSARAPATACGCSRMRSRTWCSSPGAVRAPGPVTGSALTVMPAGRRKSGRPTRPRMRSSRGVQSRSAARAGPGWAGRGRPAAGAAAVHGLGALDARGPRSGAGAGGGRRGRGAGGRLPRPARGARAGATAGGGGTAAGGAHRA